MSKLIKQLRQWFLFSARGSYFVLLMLVLPILILAGFGGYALLAHGYWLIFVIVLLVSTLLGLIPLALIRTPASAAAIDPQLSSELLQAATQPDYWTEFDRQVQQQMLPRIPVLLEQSSQWSQQLSLLWQLMEETAAHYQRHKTHAEWAFTAPELLTAIEIASQRYQKLLATQVPGVDQIKLSSILWASDQYQRLRPLGKAYQVFRKLRMFSPEGVIAELRSQLFDRAFSGLSTELQGKLQQLILLDGLQLAIDLYGGHLRNLHQPVGVSQGLVRDQQRMAASLEPVRVGFIGQENAGKSSLINQMLQQLHAETDCLPATDKVLAYPFLADTEQPFILLDLPGLNAQQAPQQIVEHLKTLADCDVIVWVLKANQPARQLDSLFKQALQQWQTTRAEKFKKMPIIVGVLTHADRLADAAVVEQAQQYNQQLLEITPILIPSVLVAQSVQADLAQQLSEFLVEHYATALMLQLERRRHESSGFSGKKEFQRLLKGSKTMLNAFSRSQPPPS